VSELGQHFLDFARKRFNFAPRKIIGYLDKTFVIVLDNYKNTRYEKHNLDPFGSIHTELQANYTTNKPLLHGI
jgi:hypothetical protein